MPKEPTLTHNDIEIRWISDNRYYATRYREVVLKSGAVVLYTKADGTVDGHTHRSSDDTLNHPVYGRARRAILEIPPGEVIKLKSDVQAFRKSQRAAAVTSTAQTAKEFFDGYTEARRAFDEALCGLSDRLNAAFFIGGDDSEHPDRLLVRVYDPLTKIHADHYYQIES
jgi:hypothetical protein